MNIKVYVNEKVKNKHQLSAIKEYDKRLTRYCKMQMKIGESQENIPAKSYKILVNEKGPSISSEELSEKLSTLALTGKSDVAFIINDQGDYDEHIALSTMTLSTGMSLTVLYEQIYRAYRIMKNEPYHK